MSFADETTMDEYGRVVMNADGSESIGSNCCCGSGTPCICSYCLSAKCISGAIRFTFADVALLQGCQDCITPWSYGGESYCGSGFTDNTGGAGAIAVHQQFKQEGGWSVASGVFSGTFDSDYNGTFGSDHIGGNDTWDNPGSCEWSIIFVEGIDHSYGYPMWPFPGTEIIGWRLYDTYGTNTSSDPASLACSHEVDIYTGAGVNVSCVTRFKIDRCRKTIGAIVKHGWAVVVWQDIATSEGGNFYFLIFCGFTPDDVGHEDDCIPEGGIVVGNALMGTGCVGDPALSLGNCWARLFAGTDDAGLDKFATGCYTSIVGNGGTCTITRKP